MKRLIQIILLIIPLSTFGQNLWELVTIPDTLASRNINAEKDGVLLVIVAGNNDNGGMLRSNDNGNSWTLLDLPFPDYIGVHSMKYSLSGTLFLGTSFCILTSYDDGDSFEPYWQTYGSITSIKESPTGGIFAVGWGNILKSSNDGITWDTLLFTYANKYFSDIDFGLEGEFYVVGGSFDGPGTGSGFHRSMDNGITWENIGITDAHLDEIEVNPDGSIIVGGDQTFMQISYDGGVNWESELNVNCRALESDLQNNLFNSASAYSYVDLLFSEDWGNTWISLFEEGFSPVVNKISISPDNTVYLHSIGSTNNIYKSINPILHVNFDSHETQVEFYPNPANNQISFSIPQDLTLNKFIIYDLRGQKVLNGKLINNFIDLTPLNSGLYILEIETENKIIRKKIIKK